MEQHVRRAVESGRERRQERRYQVRHCRVTFRRKKFLFFGERTEHRGLVKDLSSRGFAFLTAERLRPGERLKVSFHVPPSVHPSTAEVKVDCKVHWCKELPSHQAAEVNGDFLHLSTGMRAELKSLLEDLLLTGELLTTEAESG